MTTLNRGSQRSRNVTEATMKPIGIIGVVLIVAGGIVMALQGVSYVRDRQEISVGPLEVAAEQRGFISPVVGGIVLVAGMVLVLIGRRRA
jgi:hypothetical protein